MGKSLRIFLALSAPVLGMLYGTGDYLGWWDNLSGRRSAFISLEQLSMAEGFPEILLWDDQKGFKALWKYILRKSITNRFRELSKEGKQPNVLIRLGAIEQAAVGSDPLPEAPVKGRARETSPILAGYGYPRYPTKDNNNPGRGFYACTLADLRKWIDEARNRERFIVTTILIGILSIAVIFSEVGKPMEASK